jgi:hypothetical protein
MGGAAAKVSLEAQDEHDLVVISFPGVQRFISEARSTGDVRAASEIIARLASTAADACRSAGGVLVFPSSATDLSDSADTANVGQAQLLDGMPNRVVLLTGAGLGAGVAKSAVGAVDGAWTAWVREALRLPKDSKKNSPRTPETLGIPAIQWVCVPAVPGGYAAQWGQAQRLLDARRRVRDFPAAEWTDRTLCALSPRWPAETAPEWLKKHEKANLSAANWVKRRWRQIQRLDGFASTYSIASAGYRRDVLSHLDDQDVRDALSGLMDAAGQIADSRETPVPGLAGPQHRIGGWLASSGGPWV